MSKEISGYINKIVVHPHGVTKYFSDDGVTSRAAIQRQAAEINALTIIPIAPQMHFYERGVVDMQYFDGESALDTKVAHLPEHLQHEVFKTAGSALSFIHDQYKSPMTEAYIQNTIHDLLKWTNGLHTTFEYIGLDIGSVCEYIQRGFSYNELKKCGLSVIHGDYWLNNIIGRLTRSSFELTGIIDWEMSGVGSPYEDFGVVELSIESIHPVSKQSFWSGYGLPIHTHTKKYFAVRQILLWMSEDQHIDFESDFYKPKIEFLKKTIC